MPAVRAFFYQEHGEGPVKEWLERLKQQDRKGFAKCVVRLRELFQFGHELRRPAADMLRDGIHELRAKKGHVQYRILYFFHGRDVVILAHALIKEGSAIPGVDIERALRRKERFLLDPRGHVLEVPTSEGD
jgi:phage-related protein